DNGLNLADVVEAACAVEGIDRVRLGSLEPDHLSDDMIARLKAQPKLCEQFHVALQSGCDATLKRMNRHYTTAEFREICQRLKAAFPDASFTTDVMVGFPGETEEEFEQSVAFVTEIGFSKVHVFPYSRRDGTKAAAMPAQVGNADKVARAHAMSEACETVRRRIMEAAVGTKQDVLAETRTDDGHTLGYTRGYLPCRIDEDVAPGETVTVTVYKAEDDLLYATTRGEDVV
ncbi:MAG: radical SAM protein, partial [Clostridia bacterium]|nr:radical SAM protein [Clostridia bacterium]